MNRSFTTTQSNNTMRISTKRMTNPRSITFLSTISLLPFLIALFSPKHRPAEMMKTGMEILSTTVVNPLTPAADCYAFNFDGTDDYIELANEASFDFTTEVTASFDLKLASPAAADFQGVLAKRDGAGKTKFGMNIDVGTDVIQWYLNTGSGYQVHSIPFTGNMTLDTWHSFNCKFTENGSDTDSEVIIDGGTPITFKIIGVKISDAFNDAPVTIGATNSTTQFLKGKVDNVLISGVGVATNSSYDAEDVPSMSYTVTDVAGSGTNNGTFNGIAAVSEGWMAKNPPVLTPNAPLKVCPGNTFTLLTIDAMTGEEPFTISGMTGNGQFSIDPMDGRAVLYEASDGVNPLATGMDNVTVTIQDNCGVEVSMGMLMVNVDDQGCASFIGGVLTFTGTSGIDMLSISCDGTNYTITGNNNIDVSGLMGSSGSGTMTVTIPKAPGGTPITELVFNMGGDDDMLTVDFDGGENPIPMGGLTLNGQGQMTSPNGDVLVINRTAGSFTSTGYNYTNANDGSIELDGSTITYTGLEPITSTINAADVTLNYGGTSETITVTDAGGGQTTVNSTAGEMTTFNNPSNSLTINAGGGDDIVNIDGFGAPFNASLMIDGQAGTSDQLSYNTTISLPMGKVVSFTSMRNITTTGSSSMTTVDGNVDLIAKDAGTGVYTAITLNGDIITTSGTITIEGSGGSTGGTSRHGVQIGAATIDGGASGDISITGMGSSRNSSRGVLINNASSSVSTMSGNIVLDGTGGATANANNRGIEISNGGISSAGGSIMLTGTGGSGAVGVSLAAANSVTSTTGPITITGTAGTGLADLFLNSGANTINSTAGGNITINVNTADIAAGTIASNNGILLIQPRSSGTTIGLGTGVGTLQLDNTELGNLVDGFASITIGNSVAGIITSSTAVFNDDPVTLVSGSNITDNGAVGTDLTASSGSIFTGSVAPGASPGILEVSGDLTIPTGSSLDIEINGAAGAGVASGHDQVRVTGGGNVNVNGATLNLSVTVAAAAITGTPLMIIENVGGTTTPEFDGLPEGAIFNVASVQFSITYVGGVGNNDVILSACDPPQIIDIATDDDNTATCTGGTAGITLEVTGNNLGTASDVTWSVDPSDAGTFVPNITPLSLTTIFTAGSGTFIPALTGTNVDITVVYTRNDGCTATETKTFTIFPPVVAPATAISNGMATADICTGGADQVTVTPTLGFGQGDPSKYTYLWEFGDPPGATDGPILGAVLTGTTNQTASFAPSDDAVDGELYLLQCTVTDEAGCSAVSTVLFTVRGPSEATIALRPVVIPYACSGQDITSPSQYFRVNITGGTPVFNVVIRGKNDSYGINQTFNVTVDVSGNVTGPLIFNNPEPLAIPITYTLVSVQDMSGCDLVITGGLLGSITIFYDPVPVADAVDDDGDLNKYTETVCHNSTVQTTVDVTVLNGNKYLVESILNPDGVVGVSISPYTRADLATIDPNNLMNTGTTSADVTYTIRPYTYGANGTDNSGTGDDCLAATTFDVVVTVEPEPVADAVDDDLDLNKYTETVCHNGLVQTTVDVTALDGHQYLVSNIVASSGDVSTTSTAPYARADLATIDAGTLTNTGSTIQTLTYTITPYSDGPDGMDDNGDAVNDCLSPTTFDIVVTVEPDPAADAVDVDVDLSKYTETVCHGGMVQTTVDVTALDGHQYLVSNIAASSGDVSTTSSAPYARADLATIDAGTLTNTGSISETLTYTITPYTNGPDGVDDGGDAINDCLSPTTFDIVVTVDPTPVADAVDDDGFDGQYAEIVCHDGMVQTTVDVTAPDGHQYLVSNIVASSGDVSTTSSAPYARADLATIDAGTLTNIGTTSETLTYTITPYTNGPDGVDDGGDAVNDCLSPITFDIVVTVDPTPVADAVDDDGFGGQYAETVCHNGMVQTTVKVTAPDGHQYLVSNIVASSGDVSTTSSAPYARADLATIDAGTLTNTGTTSETLTYTITPYTNGPDGVDNGGDAINDCLSPTTFDIVVTVEPDPAADAVDNDGDLSKYTETVCHGGTVQTTVDVTALDGHKYLVSNVVASSGDVSTTSPTSYLRSDLAVIDPGTLTNTGTTSETLTYTITPYTNGPDGVDNGGDAVNDCLSPTTFDIVVTVEPDPVADAIDDDGDLSKYTETVCEGGTLQTTVDVTALDGHQYLVSNIVASSGNVSTTSSAPYARADLATIDGGTLSNTGLTNETLTYTITPYTNGPDGMDDGGDAVNDCLSPATFTIVVTVEPSFSSLNATADARDDKICSGGSAEIDVETTLTTPNKAFKWEANYGTLSGTMGSPQSSVGFGVGVINDGPLINNSGADVTVIYTITPYTFGPNGLDDDGLGDDCLLAPALIVNVIVEPNPVATVDPRDDIICSGGNVEIDVTTVLTTPNKAFRWVADGDAGSNAGGATKVAFGPGSILDGPLTNNTNADITVTYTVTPYTFGRNGLDNGGAGDDCLGTPIPVDVVVEPAPTTDVVEAQNATICSGNNGVIDVTTLLTTPKTRFKWVADGDAGSNAGGVGMVAFGAGAITDGPLANNTNVNITVTYTITPYTFGRNGLDNGGTGDDCLGTPVMVDIVVEPEPMATASDMMETICHNSSPTITVDVIALDGNNYRVQMIDNPGGVGGVAATVPYTRTDGQTIDDGPLTNTTSATQTVTYTIVPYTYGSDGLSGTLDDCDGTSFDLMVKVEPDPMATPSAIEETICSGTSPAITVDVTAIDGNDYRVESIDNPGGVTGVAAIVPYTRTDGQMVDDGPLTNPTTVSQTVTYTIVPYTWGADGVDNDGDPLSDDCRGASFTVEVHVDPTPTISASNIDPMANVVIDAVDLGGNPAAHICSGSPLMINVTTNVANIRLRWKVTNIGGAVGSIPAYAINDEGENFFSTAGSNTFTGNGSIVTLNDDIRRNLVFELTPEYDPTPLMPMSGDECVGSPMTYRVRVWPTPEIMLAGGGVTCSGASTTGLVTSSQSTSFIETGSADGDIAYDISIDPTGGIDELVGGLFLADLNNGANDGDPSVDLSTLAGFPAALTNQTNAAITFTINVTPKFISDDPNAPKCEGPVQMISVTVEPDPKAMAVNEPNGDIDPLTETVCHNGQAQTSVDVTAIDGNNYLVESIVASSGDVSTSTALVPYTRADLATIDDGTLTNTGIINETLTYTIKAYTYGSNEIDEGGAEDDCVSPDPIVIVVTVEPNPAAVAVDVDLNTFANTETICHEGMVQTTVDVTALNGNNYLVSAAPLSGGTATGFTSAETKRADGAAIDDQVISNISNAPAVIRYTITPYSYGANGADENGDGDDCRGTTFDVDVTVQPDLITMPGDVVGVINPAPMVCLGGVTTIYGNVEYGDGTDVTPGSLASYEWRYFGGAAENIKYSGVPITGKPPVNSIVSTMENIEVDASFAFAQAGTILLQYTVTDAEGCSSDPQFVVITVKPENNAGMPSGVGPVCADFNGAIYNLGGLLTGEDPGGTWQLLTSPGLGGSLDGIAGTFDMTTVTGGPTMQQFNLRYTVSKAPCPDAFKDVTLNVQPLPDAGVGSNTKVCSDGGSSIVSLPSLLTGADGGGTWTASGSNPMAVTISDPTMVDFTGKGAGSYFFTYTVPGQSNCTGRTDTEQVEVVVVAPPNPGLNGTIIVCNGDLTNTVNLFTALGGTPQSGGSWNDDDVSGGILTGNLFNANGVTPGDYTFTYTVAGTDPCLAATATVEVTVKLPPTANAVMLTACDDVFGEPMEGTFDLTAAEGDINGGAVTYLYFRDVALMNMILTPASHLGSDGEVVFVKVTDGDGCMNVAELTLDVKPLPEAFDADLTSCENTLGSGSGTFDLTLAEPDLVPVGIFMIEYFTLPSMSMASKILDPNPTNFNASEGTIIYVKVTGAECSTAVELTLHIQAQPNSGNAKLAYAAAHMDADQCSDEGGSINLFDLLDGTQTGGGLWTKVTVGVNTGTLVGNDFNPQNITGTDKVQLVFTYTVLPTAPCLTAAMTTVHLTIQPAPDAGVGIPGYVCNNDPGYNLNDLLIGQDPGGMWSKVPPASDAILNSMTGILDVTNATPGIYQFQYTVTATDPCNNANSEVLTVQIFPTATAEAGPDKTICSDDPDGIVLTGASIGGSAVTGSWSIMSEPALSDGSLSTIAPVSDVASVIFTASVPGVYVLELASEDPDGGAPTGGPCEPITDVVTITVDPKVEVDAGTNIMVCEDNPVVLLSTLGASIGGGATSATWGTIGGDGVFDGDGTLAGSTTYTPGLFDNTFGVVILTLTTNDPDGPCGSDSDQVTVTIKNIATVDAGEDQIVCTLTPIVTLAGTFGGSATSATWTGGGGTFDPDANTPNAMYTPSAGEITAGTVTLTLNTDDPAGPCDAVSDMITITINPTVTVDAGIDQTVCADAPDVTLAGMVGGAATSGTWSGGGGTFDPDAGTLNAMYTPTAAEILAGTVTLTLTTNDPAGPCGPESDEMIITINPVAIVDADIDQTVCADAPKVTLAGMIGGAASSATWNGGGGTFDPDASTLNAMYTPSPAEVLAGTVTLTLTTDIPTGPCGAVSDEMIITINPVAIVNAGVDQTVCADATAVTLAGVIDGAAASATWSGGGGSFAPDATTLNAVYTPSLAEVVAGTVTLTLTTDDPTGPCGAVSDQMTITINPAAVVEAGGPHIVCADAPQVALNGLIGGGATTAIWAGGTGLFNPNRSAPNAIYTPSPAEVNLGSVTLFLITNDPTGPCGPASDIVTITINPVATANAGADRTVCADNPSLILAGGIGGAATSASWSGGGGIFVPDAGTLNATYTPSAAEVLAGTVTLTLTTDDPTGPCGSVSDMMTITINPVAIADAGVDQTVCADNPTITLAGSVGGSASSGTWSGGGGLFSPDASTLNAMYTPTLGEIASGSVILTLTTNDPDGPCGSVLDMMTIFFELEATADADLDQVVCSNNPMVTLAGSVGGAATSGAWSGGGGVFIPDAGTLNATYTPSAAEILAGSATLTLTTNDPDGLCGSATDMMTITINPAATVDPGANVTICYNDVVTLGGSIGGGATSAIWSTSGDGSFNGDGSLAGSTTYTPGTNDKILGLVFLTLTTNDPDNVGPCLTASNFMRVTILPEPIAETNAVDGMETICSGSSPATLLSSSTPGVVFDIEAMNTVGTVTGFTSSQTDIAPGATIDDLGTLFNATTIQGIVKYTITPRTAGPDLTLGTLDDCLGDPIMVEVKVDPVPVMEPTLAMPPAVCSGNPIGVVLATTVSSIPAVSYMVTAVLDAGLTGAPTEGMSITDVNALAGDVFVNTTNISQFVTYTVTPQAVNGCKGEPFEIKVEFFAKPAVNPLPLEMCIESTETILPNVASGSGTITSYKWTYRGGSASGFTINGIEPAVNAMFFTETIEISTVDIIVPGVIGLRLEVSDDNGCGTLRNFNVTVKEASNSGVADTETICEDIGNFQLASLLSGMPDETGTWTQTGGPAEGTLIGSGFLASFNPSGLTGTDPVIFNFTYTVDDICPPASTEVTLTVQPTPKAGTFSATADNVVCTSDGLFDLFSLLEGVAGTDYDGSGSWSVVQGQGGVLSGVSNNLFNPGGADPNDDYILRYTVGSVLPCTESAFVDVIIDVIPGLIADFIKAVNALQVSFSDQSIGNVTSWAWDFGDGNNSTDQNPVHTYAVDGTYIAKLTISNAECMSMMSMNVTVTQTGETCDEVILNQGISLISIDVDPVDKSIGSIFNDQIVAGNLIVVVGRDNTGGAIIFDPTVPLPELNTLTHFDNGNGYYAVMNNSDVLTVCGPPLDPDFRRDLNAGLNIVGYVPQTPSAPADFFSELVANNNLVLALGYEGNGYTIFDPAAPLPELNSLTEIKNSFGYEVRVLNSTNGVDWRGEELGNVNSSEYTFIAGKSNLPASMKGEQVYIVTEDGVVVGAMEVIKNGYLMTTAVYGDDSFTPELDGLVEGEKLYFQFQDQLIDVGYQFKSEMKLNLLSVEFDLDMLEEGNRVKGIENFKAFPNPFNSLLNIRFTLSEASDVSLNLFDASGRLIKTFEQKTYLEIGDYSYDWQPINLKGGIYYVQMVIGGEVRYSQRLFYTQH